MSATQVLDSNGEFAEPPQTIFLQYWGDGDPEEGVKINHNNVSWCWDRIFDQDIEYVRSDTHAALVEALEGLLMTWENKDKIPGWVGRWLAAKEQARNTLAAAKEGR